jgi:hypothetical protein
LPQNSGFPSQIYSLLLEFFSEINSAPNGFIIAVKLEFEIIVFNVLYFFVKVFKSKLLWSNFQ